MKLGGKVAIVSGGGGQGLGQGIVHCLAEEGADIAIFDISEEAAKKATDEVKAFGRRAVAVKANACNETDTVQAVQKTLDTFGRIDILVNVVGGHRRPFWTRKGLRFIDQELEDWDDHYELNLKTHVITCRAVVPHFMKQRSGKIVNIASIGGKIPGPQSICYGAIKAALIHFSRSLAVELGEYNITVNTVCPGLIPTPAAQRLADNLIRLTPEAKGMTPVEYLGKWITPRTLLKRLQTAEDIGRMVAFLVSEDAKNITGQSMNVDGGIVMF